MMDFFGIIYNYNWIVVFFSKAEGHIDFFYNDVTDLTWRGRRRRGRDRMVVGFSTTCAISAYHH